MTRDINHSTAAAVLGAVLCMCSVASATSYYVAGDFKGWDSAGDAMTETSSGVWSATLSAPVAGRHEFKITNGSWSWTYPQSNSWFYADGLSDVTITFNTNVVSDGWQPAQYRLGVSTDPTTWTLTGEFNYWTNSDPSYTMLAQGGGIYKVSVLLDPGTYQYKPVVTGAWDSIGIDGRSINTANMSITTTDSQVVDFYVDALGGTVKAEVASTSGSVSVLAPNGGGLYMVGRHVTISYTTSGTIPSVDIAYSTDHGASWIAVASGLENTGSFDWTIPDANSENCLVKVSSGYNSTILDTSDNTFTIYPCLHRKLSDINNDCRVDMLDLALLTQDWLWCGDRYNSACPAE
jgi:hypothetical protein